MIHYVKGDLFDPNLGLDALGHGVNCRGVMDAGIARQFSDRWPEMFNQYANVCLAGHLSPGNVHIWGDPQSGKWIYNIASQRDPGPNARGYWLALGLHKALDHADSVGVANLGIPMIGAGIGGLVEDYVRYIFEEAAEDCPSVNLVVVEWSRNG